MVGGNRCRPEEGGSGREWAADVYGVVGGLCPPFGVKAGVAPAPYGDGP